MGKILRWGLLSTARINRKIIPAIRAARGHRLYAVASRDPERAKTYAQEWKIAHAYGSYEELIADPEIDVIYNSLPNHLHAEWSIKAAQAGKHVLCEKPLALSPEEVDAIIAAANDHHVVIAEAFMYRHLPLTLKVQGLIQAGAIGEVRHINASFTILFDRPENYRWLPETGGGCLWDLGCYPVSCARMIMNANPQEVYGIARWTSLGVDKTFTGLLTYRNGTTAYFLCSFELPYLCQLEIIGTQGKIVQENPFIPARGNPCYLLRDGHKIKVKAAVPKQLYQGEVEDLGRAALNRANQRLPLSESREINQALTALLESARKGAPVRL